MSEKVERIAKAICRSTGTSNCVWPECGCAQHARAAIEAMREPTEAMVEAARADLEDIWFDMIRAAL